MKERAVGEISQQLALSFHRFIWPTNDTAELVDIGVPQKARNSYNIFRRFSLTSYNFGVGIYNRTDNFFNLIDGIVFSI